MSLVVATPSETSLIEDNCCMDSDNNVQDGEDLMASVDNESNASREDTVAKLEHALSRKLKMEEEQNGQLATNGNNNHEDLCEDEGDLIPIGTRFNVILNLILVASLGR